ncbi:MAG: type II secretion system protein [Patescibacteria group bacterium]
MKGFTLIELMVVVVIFALFSVTLMGLLLATLRGSNKAQLTQVLHQEGDYALMNMARTIRQGKSAACGSGQITVENNDGGTIIFSRVLNESVYKIASNSSQFLTGTRGTVSNLAFTCYVNETGQTTVTLGFTLAAMSGVQVQEKFTQDFATSVSLRND